MGWEQAGFSDGTMRCSECKQYAKPTEEPDPCLGWLIGVWAACCGHGDISKCYVSCSPSSAFGRRRDEFFRTVAAKVGKISDPEWVVINEAMYGRNAFLALRHWPRSRRKR